MRLQANPAAALAGLLLLVGHSPLANAHPYARDDIHDLGYGYLMPRQCAEYCGYNNMYCCNQGSTCYTTNGIAGCSAAAGGGWEWYTTTWTVTATFTSTISSFWPAQTASPGQDCIPEEDSGWIACGSICCASWQYCAYKGQCSANGPPPAGATYTTVVSSVTTVITTQYSAPYRVTSGVSSTATQTGVIAGETTTAGNGTVPLATSGGTSLSGGAIAGIVIGTLAGVVFLLAFCVCCVVRGLWHTVLGLLGLRKKKETTETIIEEERYSRHGSVHSRRDRHSGWFAGGGRPSSVVERKEEKKKSSGFGWIGLTAAAGTMLLLLGLRKDNKKKAQSKARSEVSSNYWSESYTVSSPSKFDLPLSLTPLPSHMMSVTLTECPGSASTRRSRRTDRSRRSRATRASRGPTSRGPPSRVPSRVPSNR